MNTRRFAWRSRRSVSRAIRSAFLVAGLMTSGCASPPVESTPNPGEQALLESESAYFSHGDYQVIVEKTVWTDARRNRDIAVKLYQPQTSDAVPVMVFSHGLGGSSDAAEYLGRHLASWGILSVHIQHPGSDINVWKEQRGRLAIIRALKTAAANPQTAIDRFEDLPFVLDQISARSSADDLNADLSRIGMAGHSFGAHSVIAAAGRNYVTPDGTHSFGDARIKAAVALSPSPPGRQNTEDQYAQIYEPIAIPILHMTGTRDTTPLDRNQSPEVRETPYRYIQGAPQYLIVFDGADHGVFSGQRLGRPTPEYYPRVQTQVSGVTTAFLLAHLIGDPAAIAWLDGAGLTNALSDGDRIERK